MYQASAMCQDKYSSRHTVNSFHPYTTPRSGSYYLTFLTVEREVQRG